jgi:hypothetical protein
MKIFVPWIWKDITEDRFGLKNSVARALKNERKHAGILLTSLESWYDMHVAAPIMQFN